MLGAHVEGTLKEISSTPPPRNDRDRANGGGEGAKTSSMEVNLWFFYDRSRGFVGP
jgi:hypothetical protein